MPKGPKGEKRLSDIGSAINLAKIATGDIEQDTEPTDSKTFFCRMFMLCSLHVIQNPQRVMENYAQLQLRILESGNATA